MGLPLEKSQKKASLKLSLTAKSLILVCTPLVFELAMFGLFSNLLQQSEAEAKQVLHAREISDRVNKLTGDIYDVWALATKANSDDLLIKGRLKDATRSRMTKLKVQYAKLTELTVDEPDLRLNIEHSSNAIKQAETIFESLFKQIDAGDNIGAVRTYKTNAMHMRDLFTGLLSQELLLVAKHEEHFARESTERQTKIRKQIMDLLPVAVVGNVLFSIVLAIFLVQQITARLSALNENIRRFARHKPLVTVPGGNDEIADLDKAFREMAAALEQSNNQKSEFVNMLTHDLRSPLATIQGCIELAELGMLGTVNDRGERLFQSAERNGKRMMSMINSLLDIYKIEEGKLALELTAASIDEIFEEVESNLGEWLKENGVTLATSKSALVAEADKEKLGQVVFNLVANAFKYSPAQSTITVSAQSKDGQIEIMVSDQGPGIPAEMRQVIFDRFYQIKDQSKVQDKQQIPGSGLGLAICRSIVQLQGGKIWIAENPSGGSIFHFTVPEYID